MPLAGFESAMPSAFPCCFRALLPWAGKDHKHAATFGREQQEDLPMIVFRSLVGATVFIGLAAGASSAEEPKKPKQLPDQVSYYRDVRPVFQGQCQGCHQPAKAGGGYVMTDHASLLKAGDHEKLGVVPGKIDASDLLVQVTPKNGKAKMPKGKPPLSEYDIQLITKWIVQGAKDDTPASQREIVDADHPPVYTLPPVITSLDFSPDGHLLAVSGYHEVLLHKADGSGLVARLVGLSERIQSLAFSPDGAYLAVTGGSPGRFGEVQVWEVAKKKLRLSHLITYDTLYGVSWSPDGGKVAFGCADNTLRAIDAKTGEQVLFQGAHNDWVLNTVFSTDGLHLVSVSRDRSMKLTEVETQRFIDNITSITPGALKGGLMTVSRRPLPFKYFVKSPPDPANHLYDELVVGGSDGVPRVYKMHREVKRVIGDDANKIREFAAMPGRINTIRCSADGSRFAAGSSLDGKGEVRVYRLTFGLNPPLVAALCSLPVLTEHRLAPIFFMGDYRVIPNMVPLAGQKGAVYTVAFRPDGKAVASAGFDGVVRLNDPQTGQLVKEFVPVHMKTESAAK